MRVKHKKALFFFLPAIFCVISTLVFAGCTVLGGEGRPPTDIMADIIVLFPEIPPARAVYFEGAGELESGYLSPGFASVLYNGKLDEDFTELSLLESFAVRVPDSLSVFEIHIMRVKNRSDADKIKALFERRIRRMRGGGMDEFDPRQYYGIIEKAEVVVDGKNVYLLSTPDNEAVKRLIGVK